MSAVAWVIVTVVVLGAVVALFGWDRYRGSRQAGGIFQPTSEVFTDPATYQVTRVWHNPVTGEREYRPESNTASVDSP